jgi:hypothetical protein
MAALLGTAFALFPVETWMWLVPSERVITGLLSVASSWAQSVFLV